MDDGPAAAIRKKLPTKPVSVIERTDDIALSSDTTPERYPLRKSRRVGEESRRVLDDRWGYKRQMQLLQSFSLLTEHLWIIAGCRPTHQLDKEVITTPIRLLASTVGPKCGFVEDLEEDDDEMWLVNFRNVS